MNDDFPLLLAAMRQMGSPEIFDHPIKRDGLHQGLSWGWIASIWLAHLLRRLSQPDVWQAIEKKLSQNIIRVYDLTAKRVGLDAATVSGYYTGGEESLVQYV